MSTDRPMPGSSLPQRSGSVDEALTRLLRYRDEKRAAKAAQYAEKVAEGKIAFPYKD